MQRDPGEIVRDAREADRRVAEVRAGVHTADCLSAGMRPHPPDGMKNRRPLPNTQDVRAFRATISIAFGALFFASGLALGDFTGTVLMLAGLAAFLGAVS